MFAKLKNKVSKTVANFKRDYAARRSAGQGAVGGLIGSLISVVVGLALYPVVSDAVANANATGIESTLIDLVPTLYVIGIIVGAIAWLGLSRKL